MAIWKGSKAAEYLQDDFDNNRHMDYATVADFKASRPGVYDKFSTQRIAGRLGTLLQNTKEFGQTPGQAKAAKSKRKKLLSYHPEESRKGGVAPFVDGKPAAKKKAPSKPKKRAKK